MAQNAFLYGFDFNLYTKPSNVIYGSKFQPYVYILYNQKVVKSIFDTFHAKTIMSFKFSCKDQHMALMKLKVFLHEIVGKTYNSINH